VRRREFILLIGSAAACPLAARAQHAPTAARIGLLMTARQPASVEAFRQGLLERGYVEGRNIVIEQLSADGAIERLPALASELARHKVDVIVALATAAGSSRGRSPALGERQW